MYDEVRSGAVLLILVQPERLEGLEERDTIIECTDGLYPVD